MRTRQASARLIGTSAYFRMSFSTAARWPASSNAGRRERRSSIAPRAGAPQAFANHVRLRDAATTGLGLDRCGERFRQTHGQGLHTEIMYYTSAIGAIRRYGVNSQA